MKTLLLVDDNEGFLEILTTLVHVYMPDLQLLRAGNGCEAIAALEPNQVDLIITDLQMPVMDGFDLMAFRNHQYPGLPIIGMTADLTPSVETKLKSLGVQRYLAKPFDVRQMVEAISRELGEGMQQIVAA